MSSKIIFTNKLCVFFASSISGGVKRSRIHYRPCVRQGKIPIENLKPTSIYTYINFYNI